MPLTEAVRYSEIAVLVRVAVVEQQRLYLAKAASVFKMGPIQQTALRGEGGVGVLCLFKQTDVSQQSLHMCVREKVRVFCNRTTRGAGAAPHT